MEKSGFESFVEWILAVAVRATWAAAIGATGLFLMAWLASAVGFSATLAMYASAAGLLTGGVIGVEIDAARKRAAERRRVEDERREREADAKNESQTAARRAKDEREAARASADAKRREELAELRHQENVAAVKSRIERRASLRERRKALALELERLVRERIEVEPSAGKTGGTPIDELQAPDSRGENIPNGASAEESANAGRLERQIQFVKDELRTVTAELSALGEQFRVDGLPPPAPQSGEYLSSPADDTADDEDAAAAIAPKKAHAGT